MCCAYSTGIARQCIGLAHLQVVLDEIGFICQSLVAESRATHTLMSIVRPTYRVSLVILRNYAPPFPLLVLITYTRNYPQKPMQGYSVSKDT